MNDGALIALEQPVLAALAPNTVQGLAAWYDAGSLSYQDSGLTTPATADAAPVAALIDRTGNGRHLLQATAGRRPTLRLAQLAGYPILRFDGTDDYLQTAAMPYSAPLTIFAVLKLNSAVLNATVWDGRTVNVMFARQSPAAGDLALLSPLGPAIVGFGTGTFYTVTAISNGASSTLQRNEDAAAVGTTTTGINPTGFTLGASAQPGSYANADVAEVLLYVGALSAGDQTIVKNYLRAKYAHY